MIENGARQIGSAHQGRSAPLVDTLAMLTERDGLSETVAEAQLKGFLVDLEEILTDAAGRR